MLRDLRFSQRLCWRQPSPAERKQRSWKLNVLRENANLEPTSHSSSSSHPLRPVRMNAPARTAALGLLCNPKYYFQPRFRSPVPCMKSLLHITLNGINYNASDRQPKTPKQFPKRKQNRLKRLYVRNKLSRYDVKCLKHSLLITKQLTLSVPN
jgi:hypothetical protein